MTQVMMTQFSISVTCDLRYNDLISPVVVAPAVPQRGRHGRGAFTQKYSCPHSPLPSLKEKVIPTKKGILMYKVVKTDDFLI